MIGVFKNRNGWILEKKLSRHSPLMYYNMPLMPPISAAFIEQADPPSVITSCLLRFYLVDYWKNAAGEYVKVFYEEI